MEIVLSFVKINAHLYLDMFDLPLWSAFAGISLSGVGTFCFSLAVLLRVFPEGWSGSAVLCCFLGGWRFCLASLLFWPCFKEQHNIGEG